MSRRHSMKEALLGLYLKERPNIIAEVLGFEVHHMALEQKHGAHNIDVKCVDKKRRIPILFELQITQANKSYLNKIKKMIVTIPEAVIIWVARSFDEVLLKELQQWLKNAQPPYIDFYAISIDQNAMPILQRLNDMYILEIYQNLYQLDKVNPILSIELQRKRIPINHCGYYNTSPIKLDYKLSQDVKHGLLLHLRKTIPAFLNFHYDKKGNQYDRTLNIGAGKYGVVYRCSAHNRNGKAFVELYFDRCLEKEYEAFKKQQGMLKKEIHSELIFNKRRIGVYFEPANTHDQTFEIISEIFKKMIYTFSPYLYGGMQFETIDHIFDDEIVYMAPEIEERNYETEESLRIKLEEVGERFSI